MSGMKWKKIKVLKYAVGVLLIGIMVCGCGKEEATVTDESAIEVMEETISKTSVEEEEVISEEQVTDDVEVQESVEPTEMVDWETFAAQEGNEEICVVVYNEITGHQEILLIPEGETNVLYIPKEGDKFAVPIREEIWWIDFTTIKNLEIVSDEKIYFRDESSQLPEFLEVSFPKGSNYNLGIGIWSEDTDEYMQFFIQNE